MNKLKIRAAPITAGADAEHFWVVHDGDATAVHDPGSWALMAVGLAVVGLARRRHD